MDRRAFLSTTLSLAGAGALAACTTPETPAAKAETRNEIDSAIPGTLSTMGVEIPGATELANKATGMLVFPSVTRAGVGIGGQFGRGALRIGGHSVAYYEMRGGSLGVQLGVQTRSVVILFMTKEALASFQASQGWTVGADASVAVPDKGAVAAPNSETAQQQVIGLVFNNTGLMFSASLDGTKITRIDI
jgi:lipid-binding SYLF domain-containing protein